MLRYEPEAKEVQLVVDRGYREGEPINAWFGPQPNQRAFLNYGIVDENNPHDKMALEVGTILAGVAFCLIQHIQTKQKIWALCHAMTKLMHMKSVEGKSGLSTHLPQA